jgi:hypothetical protein
MTCSSKNTSLFSYQGNICPGLAKSCGLVSELARDKTVLALSAADIPVVTPPLKSTETVNGFHGVSIVSNHHV